MLTKQINMNTVLWIAQGILAAMFLMGGMMKLFQPIEKIVQSGPWAARKPASLVRTIGVAEISGALGLILPMLLDILPILTPIAACALGLIMILAAMEHAKFKENKMIPVNLFLLVLCIFVAYGRF